MAAAIPRRLRSCRSACISLWCWWPASGCRPPSSPGSNTSRRSSADMTSASLTVDRDAWQQAGDRLHSGERSLVSLWGEPGLAHVALSDAAGNLEVLPLRCGDQRFPSIGRLHPPAIRLERTMRDLVGLEAEHAPDARPWLRHS